MKTPARLFLLSVLSFVLASCTTYNTIPAPRGVDNSPGRPTIYEDPETVGAVAGVGIESQDLESMTGQMIRDMLATPVLAQRKPPPRVIIDSEYFRNESSSRINKNYITDQLRVDLNRSAGGRMIFVGRHYSDMVERERRMKRSAPGETGAPAVDAGTLPSAPSTMGGDFRLGGRIASLDAVNSMTGLTSRTHQIIFEMVDLESGEVVWGGRYVFKKTAQDNVIYR